MAKKSNKQESLEASRSSHASNQSIDDMVKEEPEGKLLSSQERDICIRIAEGDTIHSQRAQALLAIDDGATQAQAGLRAGLTRGQVGYWLGKYRKIRLDIFPEIFLKKEETGLVISQAEALEEGALSAKSPGKAKKSKSKKSKKKKGKPTTKKKKKPKKKKGKDQGKKKNEKKSK